jgi:diaminopimelate epimerase
MLKFVKSHGLGNDYLVIVTGKSDCELNPARVRQICDRHTGIGADGVLVPMGTSVADFGVRIWNPDGSEGEKSGNGLRIFGKFLYDHGYTQQRQFSVSTLGGVVRIELLPEHGTVTAVRVDMGMAVCDRSLGSLLVEGQEYDVTAVSLGNPHAVVVVSELGSVDLCRVGPLIENHPAFPQRTNVQFVKVLSRRAVEALIWERGAGHTLSSGSSSCAIAAACVNRNLVDRSVTVHMEGGDLDIEVESDMKVIMTGPVEEICIGALSADFVNRMLAE